MRIHQFTMPTMLTIAGMLTAWITAENAPAITGLEVMKERERRHERPFEESWVVMNLYGKDGTPKKPRLMVTYSREVSGLDQRLLKFSEPADIRNVGLLTWEQPDEKEDDQWLYLPASRQVKRIAGGGKKNLFMGTDLAYEDLRPENLAAYDYEITGETEIDGAKCWVVTATPKTGKEKADTGYAKKVYSIRQDIYFTVRTEFYNRRGKLSKVGTFERLVKVAEQTWRCNLATVERPDEGTKTVIIHKSRTLDKELPASLFTQQGLRRPVESK